MTNYTDLAYLKDLTDNEDELIVQSLKRYLNTSSIQLNSLLTGLAEKNLQAIHNSAHSLFATTQIVGITHLAPILKDLQVLAKDNTDPDRMQPKIQEVKTVIEASYEEIKQHLENYNNNKGH